MNLFTDEKIYNKEKFSIILNESSNPAIPFDKPIDVWIKENKSLLLDYMEYAYNLSNAIGLASTQTNYKDTPLKNRFFCYRKENDEKSPMILVVNPMITKYYGTPIAFFEGCLSWPKKRVLADRYYKIDVSYYNIDGEFKEDTLSGLEAQVWQHEIDHLEGVQEKICDECVTYKREKPKIGRNDPCPCGSNKKFKKCCGKNE